MKTSYETIFENNKAWVQRKRDSDPEFFNRLAREQHPEYLFIGCSDSRVPANDITGLEPGNLFVHRNIANMVQGSDVNVQSVIEYAAAHLDIKHIVICGHYGCGGIKAAMQPKDFGLLNPWLSTIRDVYRLHREELESILDETGRYNRLVELNVQEQCINVCKSGAVQANYFTKGYPDVHGWVYELNSGLLVDLQLDMPGIMKRLTKIYKVVP